jgi:hypothetical protein
VRGVRVEKLGLTGSSKHGVDDSMKGLSALFIDGERVFIDNGAIHAKSHFEKSLSFVKELSEIQVTKEVWVFWITLHRFDTPEGKVQGYYGAMPFCIYVDEKTGQAYKNLAEQVNKMEKAVKGQVDLTKVPEDVRTKAAEYLKKVRPDLWEHAGESFRKAFVMK